MGYDVKVKKEARINHHANKNKPPQGKWRYKCPNCGSTRIEAPYYCRWDVESQEWIGYEYLDDQEYYCGECEDVFCDDVVEEWIAPPDANGDCDSTGRKLVDYISIDKVPDDIST